jgi:drug/metabolite transporter (DMT)-like permease
VTGAILALASAATFGLNTAVVRRSARHASAYALIMASIVGATPVFLLLAAAAGELQRASELGGARLAILAGAGVLNFLGGRYSNYRAIHAMGANLTAPLRTLAALFGAALGVIVLGEQLTVTRGVGVLLLVAAPMIAFSRPADMRRELLGGPPLRLAEGFLFAFTAAVSYGGSTFLIRASLMNTGLSLLGAAVAHAAASVLLVASLAFGENRKHLQGLSWKGHTALAVVTTTMVGAQICRFAALEMAPVSVVAPLIETQSFMGLGFAYLVNKQSETFNPMVIGGLLLAVTGAIAVTM